MSNSYERGSLWRKWDLHIHTPKSIIQNYGGDTPSAWEQFITDLENLPKEYKVIGINDYIYIDGYKKVLKFKESGRLNNIDLILPVIELRADKFASIGDEAWRKLNLHVIFSDTITPEEIEAQFLSAIQHSIKLSPDVEDIDFKGVATKEALQEIGKKVKETTSKNITWSDLKVGFWNIFFDYQSVMDIVRGYFKGKCLTAVGKTEWDTMRWDGSAALKKSIINLSHFSFISLNSSVDYEKHTNSLINQNVRNCLLDCSDAHNFSNSIDKDRIGNSFTWLKADPTFKGLMQVANDPSRIFIGDLPHNLVRLNSNRTKFIDSLLIDKIEGSTEKEKWFQNFKIPLNHSMVAIIGNKGNGKSAIADTIGLLGGTLNYSDFSFLNKKKFRKLKPTNKSTQFHGLLTWVDGSSDESLLSDNPSEYSVEKVKYIPQGYLEKLCNDDIKDFEKELRHVIFSHISESDRLGKENLNELVQFKTHFLMGEIENLKNEMSFVNTQIIELEEKDSEVYRKNLEQKLKEKENEKNNQLKQKPKEVKPPTDPDEIQRNKVISDKLAKKRTEYSEKNKTKIEIEKQLISSKLIQEKTNGIIQAINNFELQFEALKNTISEDLNSLNLNFNDIVSLNLDKKTLIEKNESEKKRIFELTNQLENPETGLNHILESLIQQGTNLKNKLGESSKAYQKNVDALNHWKKVQIELEGDAEKIGTIQYYKSQLKYLHENLDSDIKKQFDKRFSIVRKIYRKKKEIVDLYKTLFKPVSDFISNYRDKLENYRISIDVDFIIKGLVEKFFNHISLGSKGSFIGNPQGIEKLKSILESCDLNNEDGLINFLSTVIDSLKFDKRTEFLNQKREINKQLKSGYDKSDLYSFLFELDFLEPEYRLKLGNKDVTELSPGERGALLLIFYLSIDQSDIPLVIDQPEENLDNQSVFTILVQFIIKAKEHRQIVIVTHNPNLAVACNAEQIIHLSIDKANKNLVSRVSGSLENPIINDAVIDVLEGTYPALRTRTRTYSIIQRR